MSNYIPHDNTGNLFRIDPEYEGEFKFACPHCGSPGLGWVKGWVREAKNGKKYFSLAFKFRGRSRNEAGLREVWVAAAACVSLPEVGAMRSVCWA